MMQELRLVYRMADGREKILSVQEYHDQHERQRVLEKLRREAWVWNSLDFGDTYIREDGHAVSVSPLSLF